MMDELAEAEETKGSVGGGAYPTQEDDAWGDEIRVGAGGPQPLWLKLLPYALCVIAIWYMLVNAGDNAIIIAFVVGLALWAGYNFYTAFLARR